MVYDEYQPYENWTVISTPKVETPITWYNEPYTTTTCTKGLAGRGNGSTVADFASTGTVSCASLNYSNTTSNVLRSFDMGSGWGKSKESKVTSTEFSRGNRHERFEIYYASREALIDMGVIQPKVNQVAFPKSFPKYAKPPSGWVA
jgi:hypothetical protein